MKKLFLFLLLAPMVVMFAGCNDDNDDETSSLTAAPSALSFDFEGGAETFAITSNVNWTVSSDETWCTVSTAEGSNNATITVTVASWDGEASRTATITIAGGDITRTVGVTQTPEGEEPEPGVPAKATITGDSEGETSVLLTADAKDADTYVWYKGTEKIDGATAKTYTVTESGTYHAAGVNTIGEGEQSEGKVVTITGSSSASFADEMVGTWSAVEFWAANSSAYNNDHEVVITKIDENSIRISNFNDANAGNTGDPVGDEVIATLNSVDRTFTIAWQEILPTWDATCSTYYAPIKQSQFADNYGLDFDPQTVTGTDGNLSVTFTGLDGGTIDGVAYKSTYFVMAVQDNAYVGGFGYCLATVWTKTSSRTSSSPKTGAFKYRTPVYDIKLAPATF